MKQLLLVRRILKMRLFLVELFRPRELQLTLFWAGVIGALGGLASSAFRGLIAALQFAFTGRTGGLVHTAESLPWWWRMAVPAVGALVAGLILTFGARVSRGRRSTDFMEAIVLGDGQMPARPILVRCSSSLVSIASGGSLGREGPMVQLAAMLASAVGRRIGLPVPRLRLLVACGVAAGIASAYRAPLAGSMFVAEIVLGSIAMESFGPLVFSAVIATQVSRWFADARPLYGIDPGGLGPSWEAAVPLLLLSVLAGSLAPLFLRLLRSSEHAFARLPLPLPLRLATGGLMVGAISVAVPEVWGNGYSVVTALLHENWAWDALALILATKLLATAATVGSGAVGGVFTPTLLIGAVTGLLFEKVLHVMFPLVIAESRVFALVGMGAFLAATTHAPLMAIIMLFEVTLDYDIILPLMLACVTAYYTAYGIDRRSIYTEAIARKQARLAATGRRALRVADLLRPDPPAIRETAPLVDIALVFARNQNNSLYVVDAARRLRGIIALGDIRDFLNEPLLSQLVAAYDIMDEQVPVITPAMSLAEAAQQFIAARGERLPVVADATSRTLVGSVSKTDLLLSLADGARAAVV